MALIKRNIIENIDEKSKWNKKIRKYEYIFILEEYSINHYMF